MVYIAYLTALDLIETRRQEAEAVRLERIFAAGGNPEPRPAALPLRVASRLLVALSVGAAALARALDATTVVERPRQAAGR